MNNSKSWLAPLTGLAFVVVVIVAFFIGGEPPDPDELEEVVEFYTDKDSAQMFSAAFAGVASSLFVFFGGYLRKVLRAAEGENGWLSAVAFAGTIIFAVGLALDATITFALADSADDIDPTALQALSALWSNDFVPFSVGVQVFALATGISLVRFRALPRWIGWVLILIGVVAITPIGFFAFLLAGILIGVMSVMLSLRERRGGQPASAAAGSELP